MSTTSSTSYGRLINDSVLNSLRDEARAVRKLVLKMCSSDRGGYAGQGVALADLITVLLRYELRTQSEGIYVGRYMDRFVMSNGHHAIVVYAGLAQLGLYESRELLTYGEDGSRIEMSPIEGELGFEMTAGSLGEGPSQAAGMAYGHALRGEDVHIYCLLSDGELQEGNVWEAAMFAGFHKLGNLTLLVDNNHLQADGVTDGILNVEPVADKFSAFGFHSQTITGSNIKELISAFDVAREHRDRPQVIVCNTRIFDGVPYLQRQFPTAHYLRTTADIWQRAIEELETTGS